MKKFKYFILFFFSITIVAFAVTPSSGFPGVAVSKNGKLVAVGGISRVVYVLDAENLKVMKRIPVMTQILNLGFNNDHTMLISENRDETLNFIDLKQEKIVRQFRNSYGMVIIGGREKVLVLSGQRGKYSVNIHSLTDGSLLLVIPLPSHARLLGADPDFKRLVVLCSGPNNKEKKTAHSQIPKDLKGMERSEFIQRNDGKISLLLEFDPRSGETVNQRELYFTVSQYSRMLVTKEETLIVTYGNVNARISRDGRITLFKEGKQFNYGIGFSSELGILAAGGLRRGMIKKVPQGSPAFFSIPSIPGWPEYFKGFAFSSDGSVYASTSAFRLIKFDPAGKAVKAVYVF